jgi:hypothetical protein
VGGQGALMQGREAAGRLAWADAYTALSVADQSSSLVAEDLELLATAAYLLGRMDDCLRALQRAQQLHAGGGDPRRAARCAFWLTFHYGSRGDLAQASGWFGRANRLLEHERGECAEHGYLMISAAYQQLMGGTTRARGSCWRKRPGSAPVPVTPIWLPSGCTSKVVPWCGKVG